MTPAKGVVGVVGLGGEEVGVGFAIGHGDADVLLGHEVNS